MARKQEHADVSPKTAAEPLSKMDMVREALREGYEGPEEGTAYIRQKYRAELTRPMFSTYKANIKRKENSGDILDVLPIVKELVQEFGAERIKKVIDLFEC